ncbi:MAG: M28 family metallopeptidase [Pseudomonadota bacterium]
MKSLTPVIAGAVFFLLAACDGAPGKEGAAKGAIPDITPDAIQAHIAYLADDARQGRETGTPGYDDAARYVADQFAGMGLVPAGDAGGYFQTVPLRASRALAEGAQFIIERSDGTRLALGVAADFVPALRPDLAVSQSRASAVFVGYGIEAPEQNHDDYAGLDVAGKIVVALAQAPTSFPSEIGAYYGSGRTKAKTAARHGAVGMVMLYTERFEKVLPFEEMAEGLAHEDMTWRAADGTPFIAVPQIANAAVLAPAAAGALFEGAAKSYEAVRAEAATGAPAGFALPVTLTIGQAAAHRDLESRNVAAILEGADPILKDDYVVLSAHLDHVGVGKPVNGDSIYNGALDNAAGVAILIETAHALSHAAHRPRRSILLLAVTAEEKGLIGADYFARHPTVPLARIVANVNLDMPLILYPFADVIAFGAEHSSLGPTVARAAARLDVALSPDPMPEQAIFIRSDHYRFVERGVPSVFLVTGFNATTGDGVGGKIFSDFLAAHYHKPSDDLALPIDYAAGAKFAQINYLIAREIADAPTPPHWNEGDFFGTLFGP